MNLPVFLNDRGKNTTAWNGCTPVGVGGVTVNPGSTSFRDDSGVSNPVFKQYAVQGRNEPYDQSTGVEVFLTGLIECGGELGVRHAWESEAGTFAERAKAAGDKQEEQMGEFATGDRKKDFDAYLRTEEALGEAKGTLDKAKKEVDEKKKTAGPAFETAKKELETAKAEKTSAEIELAVADAELAAATTGTPARTAAGAKVVTATAKVTAAVAKVTAAEAKVAASPISVAEAALAKARVDLATAEIAYKSVNQEATADKPAMIGWKIMERKYGKDFTTYQKLKKDADEKGAALKAHKKKVAELFGIFSAKEAIKKRVDSNSTATGEETSKANLEWANAKLDFEEALKKLKPADKDGKIRFKPVDGEAGVVELAAVPEKKDDKKETPRGWLQWRVVGGVGISGLVGSTEGRNSYSDITQGYKHQSLNLKAMGGVRVWDFTALYFHTIPKVSRYWLQTEGSEGKSGYATDRGFRDRPLGEQDAGTPFLYGASASGGVSGHGVQFLWDASETFGLADDGFDLGLITTIYDYSYDSFSLSHDPELSGSEQAKSRGGNVLQEAIQGEATPKRNKGVGFGLYIRTDSKYLGSGK